jgi:hypothetical protein
MLINANRLVRLESSTSKELLHRAHDLFLAVDKAIMRGTQQLVGEAIMNDAKLKPAQDPGDQMGAKRPGPPPQRQTIHYTELPEDASEGPIAREWNLYRREAGRLLAEGHEGKWLLVKGDAIIGIFDTEEEARAIALQKYLMQPCLIHQVRSCEPLVRMSTSFWGCRS